MSRTWWRHLFSAGLCRRGRPSPALRRPQRRALVVGSAVKSSGKAAGLGRHGFAGAGAGAHRVPTTMAVPPTVAALVRRQSAAPQARRGHGGRLPPSAQRWCIHHGSRCRRRSPVASKKPAKSLLPEAESAVAEAEAEDAPDEAVTRARRGERTGGRELKIQQSSRDAAR